MSKEPLEEYRYKEKLSLKDLKSHEEGVHKITCPSCATDVSAANLNIQTNIAKCTSCNGIFSFSNHVEKLSLQNKISQEILQPEGVEINRFRDELDIAIEQPVSALEIIALTLLPFVLFAITSVFVKSVAPTVVAKLGLLIVWISSIIGVIVYSFIRKRHNINVHIDDQNLFIERRPRKFISDKVYAIQDVDQIYTKSVSSSATGKKGFGVFMIFNSNKGQKHIELLKFVSNRSKAKYIEQEIENHLGIPDRRVPDEVV